jgi:hypothetical protein
MNLQNLVTNPWFGIVGFVVGLVSIIATIVSYVWSVRPKVPVYHVRSSLLIDKQSLIRGLKVSIDDRAIDGDIVLSTIAIWNRGVGIVTKDDITDADPLRIQGVDGVAIHDAWITRISSKANQPTIKRDNNGRILVGFDYIGKGEGFVVGMLRSSVAKKPKAGEGNLHVASLNKEVMLAGVVKGAKLIDYTTDKQGVAGIVAGKVMWPFRWMDRAPPWILIPTAVIVVVPYFFCWLPVLFPFMLVDGMRMMFNSSTDSSFVS